MRIIDADMLAYEIRERFGLPQTIIPLNGDRESIVVLEMLAEAPTIIPGREPEDKRIPTYIISENLRPEEIISRLRESAKHTRRYIGKKPRLLDDEAADCIKRLLAEGHAYDNTGT